VSGKSLPYKIVGRREGDITSAYANTDETNTVLGWKHNLHSRRSDGQCLEMGTESKNIIKKKAVYTD
jgi:UDP-glucose 4-epimerase